VKKAGTPIPGANLLLNPHSRSTNYIKTPRNRGSSPALPPHPNLEPPKMEAKNLEFLSTRESLRNLDGLQNGYGTSSQTSGSQNPTSSHEIFHNYRNPRTIWKHTSKLGLNEVRKLDILAKFRLGIRSSQRSHEPTLQANQVK